MANKAKAGLNFFPVDIDIFSDIKIKKLIRHKKTDGFTVYLYILCLIYKNGYYIRLDSESAFLISDELKCDEEFVSEIIVFCSEINLFDKKLYLMEGVLTSVGIQVRYNKIATQAKRTIIVSEFNLISSENFGRNQIDSELIGNNSEEMGNNSEGKTQSKVKKSKEKKIDEKIDSEEMGNNSEGSNGNKKLSIPPIDLPMAKKILWNNRKGIANREFCHVEVGGAKNISEYGGFSIKTKHFSKYLTNWAIAQNIDAPIWQLFAIYSDLNEQEVYPYIEDGDNGNFSLLFNRFKNYFKDTIEP